MNNINIDDESLKSFLVDFYINTSKQVLDYWYFQNKTMTEISNLMDIPVDSVADIINDDDIPQEVLMFLGITQKDLNNRRKNNRRNNKMGLYNE